MLRGIGKGARGFFIGDRKIKGLGLVRIAGEGETTVMQECRDVM